MKSIILFCLLGITALSISAGVAFGMKFLLVLPICIGVTMGVLNVRKRATILALSSFGIFMDFLCARLIGMSVLSIIFGYFLARALDQAVRIDMILMPFIRAVIAACVSIVLDRFLISLIYKQEFNANVLPLLMISSIFSLVPVFGITIMLKRIMHISS